MKPKEKDLTKRIQEMSKTTNVPSGRPKKQTMKSFIISNNIKSIKKK
jgi:hypothetical protein